MKKSIMIILMLLFVLTFCAGCADTPTPAASPAPTSAAVPEAPDYTSPTDLVAEPTTPIIPAPELPDPDYGSAMPEGYFELTETLPQWGTAELSTDLSAMPETEYASADIGGLIKAEYIRIPANMCGEGLSDRSGNIFLRYTTEYPKWGDPQEYYTIDAGGISPVTEHSGSVTLSLSDGDYELGYSYWETETGPRIEFEPLNESGYPDLLTRFFETEPGKALLLLPYAEPAPVALLFDLETNSVRDVFAGNISETYPAKLKSGDLHNMLPMDISPDGRHILVSVIFDNADPDNPGNHQVAYLIDTQTGSLRSIEEITGRKCDMACFTDEGDVLCFGENFRAQPWSGELWLMDAEGVLKEKEDIIGTDRELICATDESPYALVTPGDNTVWSIDLRSGERVLIPALEADRLRSWQGNRTMKYSPGGRWLLSEEYEYGEYPFYDGNIRELPSYTKISIIDLAAGRQILLTREADYRCGSCSWLSEGVFCSDVSPDVVGFDDDHIIRYKLTD